MDPEPTPTVTVTETSTVTAPAPTPDVCGTSQGSPCYVEPTEAVYQSWGLGLVLLVVFASAVLFSSLRRGGSH
jgi:hypothetical protein